MKSSYYYLFLLILIWALLYCYAFETAWAEEVDIDEFIDRLNELKRQYEKKHPPKQEEIPYVEVNFEAVKETVVEHCKNMTLYEAAFITFLVVAVVYTVYA